jgi:hypothetical protein
MSGCSSLVFVLCCCTTSRQQQQLLLMLLQFLLLSAFRQVELYLGWHLCALSVEGTPQELYL